MMPEHNQKSMRPIVPAEYGGKWIAWNDQETAIVGNGDTMEAALQQAEAQGIVMPAVEYVPSGAFVGGRRA